jgi:hypothetical protein
MSLRKVLPTTGEELALDYHGVSSMRTSVGIHLWRQVSAKLADWEQTLCLSTPRPASMKTLVGRL